MYNATREKTLIDKSKALLKLDVKEEIKGNQKADYYSQQLAEVINYHDWRYYVKNDPVIADEEYDRLFKMLQQIEQKWPDSTVPHSPTQRVASGLTKEFPTVEHLRHMLSLDSTYKGEGLQDFDRRVRELTGLDEVEYTVEPKYDGSGISIIYEDDVFVRGATRGDGARGDDITNNLKLLPTIPLSAHFSDYDVQRVEIRGEVLMNKEVFKSINKRRVEEGKRPFANPRNAAAGSLRLQDAEIVAQRGLEAFLYQISYAADKRGNNVVQELFPNHNDNLALLNKLGCKTPRNEMEVVNGVEDVLAYCKEWEKKREDLNYEIDGMVVKVNNLGLYDKLGVTSHHPRWAMAYKFKPKQKTTRIKKVEFNVGRTGAVTPIAKLEPVRVGGVTVSSVSMFNEDFVKEKDIREGDTVLVERAGDVIPYIVKPIKEAREGDESPIEWPKQCPACQTDLIKDEAIWRCPNLDCPKQVLERLIHFVSKDAMDIDGLGEALVKRFYELGFLQQLPDIYRLPYQKIEQLEGFGQKSVQNLKEAVEASKKQPIHRLLFALGIMHVGTTTAKMLADQIQCINELEQWSKSSLLELADIGPVVARSIYHFFHTSKNQALLRSLEEEGVKMCMSQEEKQQSDQLDDVTFVFTGALDHFTRSQAKEEVEQRGGRVVGSVSGRVDYVVVGEGAGSKREQAQEQEGVKILDETQFKALLED